MAPEIIKKVPYQGRFVDLYAAGVVLFMLVVKANPYQLKLNTEGDEVVFDEYYECI